MSLSTRVAYLRGLADGAGLTNDENQGKFIQELLDCLEDMTFALEFLEEDHDDLEDYLENVDYDLHDLEDFVYDEFFDDDEDDDEDEDYLADDDSFMMEMDCPECGETVYFYDDDDDETVDIICPYCEEVVITLEGADAFADEDEDESEDDSQ